MLEHFASLDDSRRDHGKLHRLEDILVLTISAGRQVTYAESLVRLVDAIRVHAPGVVKATPPIALTEDLLELGVTHSFVYVSQRKAVGVAWQIILCHNTEMMT